jgi:transcriptional regulator GlxA family with amidase domain
MSAPRQSESKQPRSLTRSIGILVFDDVEELDFVGPWEVFGVADRLFPGSFPLRLLSTGQSSVRARYGLNVQGVTSIHNVPELHLLILPGGQGRRIAMQDASLLAYLKSVHSAGTVLASVCTGAFILAAAGLLDGKSATTHWSALDELQGYPSVKAVQKRFVDEGDIVTSAGISAGIDMSLHLVGRFLGENAANQLLGLWSM